jgi:hypothetical protein
VFLKNKANSPQGKLGVNSFGINKYGKIQVLATKKNKANPAPIFGSLWLLSYVRAIWPGHYANLVFFKIGAGLNFSCKK